MGEFARTLQTAVRDALAARVDGFEWVEEHGVGGTPVDVAGVTLDAQHVDVLVAVELEVRRADPANNTVKLLRNLDEGVLDAYDRVVVCQVFSAYYDLVRGDVSTKRKNATFVGEIAERAEDRISFHAIDLPVTPPKRGGEPPEDWPAAVETTVDAIGNALAADVGL